MSASTTVGSIEYTLSIETANLIRAQKETEAALASMERRGKQFEGQMGQIAASIAAMFSVGAFVSGLKAASDAAMKFEKSISNLAAITGATGKDLKYLEQTALEFGKTTTVSAVDAVEAMKLLASAKPELLENTAALKGMAQAATTLADASGMALPQAADALATSMNQMGVGADQATRYINVMAAGAKFGASEISDTSVALKNFAVTAKAVGVSFEEANAGVQALAATGIKAGEAGTALRNVLLKLENESDSKLKPSMHGLAGALDGLAAKNLNSAALTKLFGLENVNAAQALLTSRSEITKLTGQLTGTNVAYEQAATNTDNYATSLTRMKNAIDVAAIEAGTKLNPILRQVADVATTLTVEMTDGSDRVSTALQAITVGAVALAGTLTSRLITAMYSSVTAAVAKAAASRAAAEAAVRETQAALALATAEQRAAAAMAAAGMGSAGLAAANARLAAASEAAALAQRNMAAQVTASNVATRAASGIIGALGGPIGIAIMAISLLALNWDKLSGSAKSAGDITSDTAARINKALSKTGGTPMRDLQQGLEESSAELAKLDEQLAALGTGKQGTVTSPFEKGLLERREALRGAVNDQRKAIEDLKKQQIADLFPDQKKQGPEPAKPGGGEDPEKVAKNAEYIQQLRVKATQNALAKIRIEEAGELAKVAEDARKGEITQATAEQARSLIKQQYAQQRLAIAEKEAQDEAQARITMTLDEAAKVVAIREEAVRKASAAEKAGTMTAAQAARERAVAQFEAGQALAQIADKQAADRAEIAVALAKTETERIELTRAESLRRIGVAEAKGEIDAKLAADRRVIINQDADRAIAESRDRVGQARAQVQTQTLQIRAEGGDAGAKEELLRQQAAAQMQATFDAQQLDLQNAQVYADARLAIEQKLQADILAMRASAAQAQLAGASSLFGSLADIAKGFSGEQSGIYRAMFAASKAFAVAESIVKIQQGIASAAALPFPANIPAMASVAAATAGIVGTIKGTQYGGGKAQGGPVAAGSMYRINEGGRPEMYTASNGAQYMMAPDRGRITSASDVQAGGSVQWQIIVNNNAPGVSVTPQIDQSARIVTLAVTEVARQVGQNSGPVWSAMRGATNITGRVA